MKILMTTHVGGDFRDVFARFDRELLESLSPPFPPVRLVRFDGSRVGDEVHIDLKMPGPPPHWISHIVDAGETADELYFVDEGLRLPFFIKSWRHRHIVRRAPNSDGAADSGSLIIDDITYEGRPGLLGLFLYPFLYAQFLYRKPVYRRIFGRPSNFA